MIKNNLLSKSITVLGLALASVSVASLKANTAHAAIVQNDKIIYHATKNTYVYNTYVSPTKNNRTGQILRKDSNWKIIQTAIDNKGNKWYDLGKNQWVKAEKPKTITKKASYSKAPVSQAPVNPAAGQNNQNQTTIQQKTDYSSLETKKVYTRTRINQARKYVSGLSASEAYAKAWIAGRESGGNYSARNGQYIGKYQLSASYLHGDYSAANQERVADQYVHSRYGSWANAMRYWQANGSY